MTTHTDSFLWSKFIFIFEMCENTHIKLMKKTKSWKKFGQRILQKLKYLNYDENEKNLKIYLFFLMKTQVKSNILLFV